MITKNTIEQIQSRVDIIDIVGSFVKLKRRGVNYIGNCPFHHEKTPSFTVSPTKEIYKCFGCGRSGNSISFLMEHEKHTYVEALRWLANRYGVEIEETAANPEAILQLQTSESLFIINNFAKTFFEKELFNTEEGKNIALSYLAERGFRENIIQKFQLGYNPASGAAFAKEAIENKYSEELLLKTGLVHNRNNYLQDNYRERIIFPIHNISGKILGFGARLIKSNDKAPKYINSPENEIYSKSKILYGAYFARQAIDKANECLLVEGYTDVVSLHQAGIENVVASGGTSLTPDQLRLIKKYTNNLTIIYDGDSAGIKAALRGLDLALEEGLYVKLLLIPDNEDPDSYVHKIGAEAFNEFVQKNKKDFVLFQLEVSLKDAGDDSKKKSEIVNQIAETISKINRPEEFTRKQDYIKLVSDKLKIDEGGFINLVNKFVRDNVNAEFKKAERQPIEVQPTTEPEDTDLLHLLNSDNENEKALIRNLIEFGAYNWDNEISVANYLFKEIEDNELDKLMNNKAYLDVYEIYKQLYLNNEITEAKQLFYHHNEYVRKLSIEIMEMPNDLSPKWAERYETKIATRSDLYKEEITSTLNYLKLKKIKRMIEENQKELEETKDIEKQFVLLKTHQHLKLMKQQITANMGTVILK